MVSITVSSFAEHNCVAMSYKLTILFLLVGFSAVSLPAYSALAPEVRKERVEYIYESPLSKKEAITTLAPKIKEVAPASQIKVKAKVVNSSPYDKLPMTLQRICSCESTGSPNNIPKQFDASGNVIRGKVNHADVGMCQINTEPRNGHIEMSRKLGFDLFTADGNASYALWLYNQEGTKPWKYSSACWSKGKDATGTTSIMKL